jgi:phosphatidate cytidylyltransferase
MLIKRIFTGIILISLTLAALFYLPPPWFCVVTGIVSLGAAWEWTHLMELKSVVARIIYVLMAAVIFVWISFLPVLKIFAAASVWWLFAVLLLIAYPRFSAWWSKRVAARGMMGLFVIAPCWAAVNFVRDQSNGIYSLLFLFALVFGADTAAYFAGKIAGKHKLAPLISPGKTWEGCIGAFLFAILLACFVLWHFNIPTPIWLPAVLLAMVIVAFSIVGDLFESMMKRNAGLKDSGALLPGHGGLLDRIDSLTAAAPIFVFGGLMLGRYLA